MIWFVNSISHRFGQRPYDRSSTPTDNLVTIIGTLGEGYHNYHHTFPTDYAASEDGTKLNPNTMLIYASAVIGLATNLKRVPKSLIDEKKFKNSFYKIN